MFYFLYASTYELVWERKNFNDFVRFHFSFQMIRHLLGERPYACDICNKTFAVKSYVTAHRWVLFSKFYFSLIHLFNLKICIRWSHVSEKPLNCDRCTMTFTSKAQFAVHIRTHSSGQNYECNICGRAFIRDSYLIR